MRRASAPAAALTALALLPALAGCGLVSGSPMTDEVGPGSIGKGQPLKGAQLTVTSKEFTEQIILGSMLGLVFKAAGAQVVDRTNIQGSIGAREAVKSGDADAMYEYTGTGWITYLGNTEPIPDPQKQWKAVRDGDRGNGVTWLPRSTLNNTYALAVNPANKKKLGVEDVSDVAALSKSDPSAVTVCVGAEFASREDGLPGLTEAYGMKIPASRIKKMSDGVIYTQTASARSCNFGQVSTTDGRIKAMDLQVLDDDKRFFPQYDAAPTIHTRTLEKYPAIAKVLAPLTKALNNGVAQELNGRVDVDGEDPHEVAKDWLVEKGFIKEG
ncbi:glycine betaine ABC transporter substrate-binding protein [Streptomyces sp. XM4193]|uniref:glycine betaine ABC transporter substrate-binding protein n=1 Tax=Streptomyces sp. XM4193 TaxID=2929782 RepID=UPI0035ABB7FF